MNALVASSKPVMMPTQGSAFNLEKNQKKRYYIPKTLNCDKYQINIVSICSFDISHASKHGFFYWVKP